MAATIRSQFDTQGLGMTSQRARDRLVERLRSDGIRDEVVLEAIRQVPRHVFVDEALASRAYEDTALPIGLGQTISQPHVVALMSQIARDGRNLGRVLEVGTGSGYQAAVLALLADQVFTLERIDELLRLARRRFRRLGLDNIRTRHADGRVGWAEEGPFDAIVVTAAASELIPELMAQLSEGGILVAPVGPARTQRLLRLRREGDRCAQADMGPVIFVPLLGGMG